MNEQASPAAPPALRKRAWFQLHLSTCVVLMLAAGFLVWANVRERFNVDLNLERGWPLTCHRQIMVHFYSGPEENLPDFDKWPFVQYLVGPLFMDFGVGITILAAIAAFCEWFIRRRRKSAARM